MVGVKRKLIGTVGLGVKVDGDLKEPPCTVGKYRDILGVHNDNLLTGELHSLLVVPQYRREGVAQELVLRLWDQCLTQFRAVELETSVHTTQARKLFEKQDWVLMSVREIWVFGLVKRERMIYRRPCTRTLHTTY